MKKYNLEFTEQELLVIGEALSNMPYKVVNLLLDNIQQQVNIINQPTVEVEKEVKNKSNKK